MAQTRSIQPVRESVRHIVWDWNGTILADNHAVVAAVNTVCAHFGRDSIDLDHWRTIFGRPLRQCYERLLRVEITEQDWARLDFLYHEAYRDLLHTCDLADGVPAALRGWADTGGTQSLLSMWFHQELLDLVTERELHTWFDRIDGLRSEVGGGSKASHLAEHLAALHLDPEEVVLVGDVLDDAHAAESVGASCVLLTTGVMARESLETAGVPVAESVTEAMSLLTAPAN